jgi:alpha-L-fucosidase
MFQTLFCVSFPYKNSLANLRRQDYWFQGPQDTSGDIRFLTTPHAFCIVTFSRPTNGQLVINKRLPILPGDKIVLLNPSIARHKADRSRSDSATGLPWSLDPSGQLTVNVSESDLSGIEYAWAFQVQYRTEE